MFCGVRAGINPAPTFFTACRTVNGVIPPNPALRSCEADGDYWENWQKKGPEKTILVNKRPVARDFAIFARFFLNHWRTTRYAKCLVCVPTKKVLWHCQSTFFRDHLSGFMLSSQLFHQVISVVSSSHLSEMTRRNNRDDHATGTFSPSKACFCLFLTLFFF